jgi:hypothetical protein
MYSFGLGRVQEKPLLLPESNKSSMGFSCPGWPQKRVVLLLCEEGSIGTHDEEILLVAK